MAASEDNNTRLVEEALPCIELAGDGAIMMGGKLYLSGWTNFDAAGRKLHYGDQWPKVMN